ncbi:aldehyde dehydrogenase family protein [Flavobacterium rakeshii]|uniref:aldehyde dehydrogenase (NAD(+)) n=1 Tax=Flavobacterium rakeshii TaxID=1038845 RepID=A0A6N8HG32_9FLAO|nr:aldehyde dehydrogenase family protein [Flavobacterium rakeshii]MUV04658.1 aldehyde dehydrogenase family protein [Flavobacterium rakeshii]
MKILDQIYVNGNFVKSTGAERFNTINPATNEKLAEVHLANSNDLDNAVAAAKKAFQTFSKSTREERIDILKNISDVLSRRKKDFIETMVTEYGGTLQFSEASFSNALSTFSSTIEILENFDFERSIGVSKLKLQPVGVVGIITPWNASNSFICSKMATAIAAGCTAVVKPSEMSALQSQVIMEVFHDAGLPPGVFNLVNGFGNTVGTALTSHKDISKISFTGSTVTGKSIARIAVDTMKRVTLELGGKSPNIILADADLATTIPMAVYGAYMNSGQACIAPTRLLVPADKLEQVNHIAKTTAEGIKIGNPLERDTIVGPMVSVKQFERVQNYIRLGIEEGATLLTGGTGKPQGLDSGNFVKATVFTNVSNSMRIAQEEIFGPVLCIIPYKDEDEAIQLANDTAYGLAAYVSAADDKAAERVAAQIDAGRVCINGFSHDPLAPFGGFKQSGIGREYGVYGLEEYLEVKAILN